MRLHKNSKKDKICPECGRKDKVIPIVYGFPIEETLEDAENGKVKLGGCVISGFDPQWYCKRDDKKF